MKPKKHPIKTIVKHHLRKARIALKREVTIFKSNSDFGSITVSDGKIRYPKTEFPIHFTGN